MWPRCPQAWHCKTSHFRREEDPTLVFYHPAYSAVGRGSLHLLDDGLLCAKMFSVVPESTRAMPDIWSSLCLHSLPAVV